MHTVWHENSTDAIKDTITSTKKTMRKLDNSRYASLNGANMALEHLRRCVARLRCACENPGHRVGRDMVKNTLRFVRKAEKRLNEHTTRLSSSIPVPSQQPSQKSKRCRRTTRKLTTGYAASAEIIDLTRDTSEERSAKTASKGDTNASDLTLVKASDSDPGPIAIPHQPGSTWSPLATDANISQNRANQDAEVHRGFQTRSAKGGTLDTITPSPPLPKTANPFKTRAKDDRQDGGKNGTDILMGRRGLAAKQEDSSFFNDERTGKSAMLEAAMNRRDHELWYDPTVDFDQDLLP